MEPFIRMTGIVAPLDRANVDTDQIIPKQFLKRVERTGFGEFLFFDWRYLPDGSSNPDFSLNAPGYSGASVLVAGRNFGSGSSREHAPWALLEYGFRAIIAPSFADIFYNNCFQNGVLPVALPEPTVQAILAMAATNPGWSLTVDLEAQTVTSADGISERFEVDAHRRTCMLHGLDNVGLTLLHADAIDSYERERPTWKPLVKLPAT
jgi:3-isopropylmalate/(R)-2-methylmalate dehydratase small subunit